MATIDMLPRAASAPNSTLPPLESGDRLTRREFERRYSAMPVDLKAELIEGRVYVASPVRLDMHGEQHTYIMMWLGTYAALTKGIRIGDNSTIRLDADNEPQPDALLMLPDRVGGAAIIGPDGYVEGPPELVIEIAASSASYDLHDKHDVYRRNGVREYAIWQIYERRLDWSALEDEVYAPLTATDGIVRSCVFPGLWLDVAALLGGDMAAVLAALQQGIAAEEHAAFTARLGNA